MIVVVVDFHEFFYFIFFIRFIVDFLFFGERSVSKSREESEIEKRKKDQRLVRYFNK